RAARIDRRRARGIEHRRAVGALARSRADANAALGRARSRPRCPRARGDRVRGGDDRAALLRLDRQLLRGGARARGSAERRGDARAALAGSGIRHRVAVVSACYAGGFIPALRAAHTMVIAAARADRASFGCGAESEITYFGHAFLVDALNQTEDFNAAFGLA